MQSFSSLLIENRIDHLKQQYEQDINFVWYNMNAHAWNDVVRTDPTPNKVYLQWIIRMVLHKDVRERLNHEDLYKVKESLEIYHRLKPLIPPPWKDINAFKTYRLLITGVDVYEEKFGDAKSKTQTDAAERDKALKESKILYKGSDGSVISPQTEYAATILGRGTKWCTSAKKSENMFHHYHKEGDLIMIDNKTQYGRWQFWCARDLHTVGSGIGMVQFMDIYDNPAKAIDMYDRAPWAFKHAPILQTMIPAKFEYGTSHWSDHFNAIALAHNKNNFVYLHNMNKQAQEAIIGWYGPFVATMIDKLDPSLVWYKDVYYKDPETHRTEYMRAFRTFKNTRT